MQRARLVRKPNVSTQTHTHTHDLITPEVVTAHTARKYSTPKKSVHRYTKLKYTMLCKCQKLLNILVLITAIIGLLSHFIESNNHKYWKCMEITPLRWMWKLLYCFLLFLLWLHFIYWLDWCVLPFKCKVSTDTREIYFSCITKYLHLLPPLENKGHCHKQRTLVHVKEIRQWLECVPNHTSGPSRYCTHQSNSL